MPLVTQCPNCERKLRVPDDFLGKRVRCPACKEVFTPSAGEEASSPSAEPAPRTPRKLVRPIPAEYEDEPPRVRRRREEPPPDDESEDDQYGDEPEESSYEDEPEPERRLRRRRDDWVKVQNGVGLVLISICIFVFAVSANMGAGVVAGLQAPPGAGPGQFQARPIGFGIGRWLNLALGLVADTVTLAGYFFCRSAPPKYGARAFATVCLVLGGASVVSLVVLLVGGIALDMVKPLLDVSKLFVFLFFLRAIAKCLREESLAGRTNYLIILNGVFLVGLVAMMLMFVFSFGALAVAAQQHPQAGQNFAKGFLGGMLALAACGCGEAILGLTSFVWYIITLIQTRSAIGRYLER